MGITRETLERSRFFVKAARAAEPAERESFEHYVYAAIVFGRAVTNHLQKEYKHCPGFDDWYEEQQSEMQKAPLLRFFYAERTFILKRRPTPIQKTIQVAVGTALEFDEALSVKVIRAKPWYLRRPAIMWNDLSRAIIQAVNRWKAERERERKRRRLASDSPAGHTKEFLHFDGPAWKGQPAVDLLDGYLDSLARIVAEAEEKFGMDHQGSRT